MTVKWKLFALVAVIAMAIGCTGSSEQAPTPTATVDPNEVVLVWTRSGGIAGFCDGMTVTAGHLATLGTCDDPGAALSTVFLPADWIERLEGWRDIIAPFDHTWEDPPNQTDRMTITLHIEGRGTTAATDDQLQELASFTAEMHAALQQLQPQTRVR